jgi:inhibitor of cysteine peptidase
VRLCLNPRRWALGLAISSLLVAYAGPAWTAELDGPQHGAESSLKALTLTVQDDGHEISVAVGNTVILRLEAIPGTGYGWQIVRNGSPQLQLEGTPVFESRNKIEEGGAEDEVFRFRAQMPGTADLELQYRRPSDSRNPAAKTFKVRITSE